MRSSQLSLVAALTTLSALGACATTPSAGQMAAPTPTEGVRPAGQANSGAQARYNRDSIARADALTQMTFWAAEYAEHPEEVSTAQRFVQALRAGGRNERAAEVATEAVRRFPTDQTLLYAQGAAFIAVGRAQDALVPLALVAQADARNWRARSALGAALDHVGRAEEARRAYREALAITPDEPSVLTNLGVSHLLAGEPREAETILRQAAALPNAPPAARQNLALALGLQGRYGEAEQIERIDLPPQVVAENMAYLREMMSSGRRWNDLAQTGGAASTPASATR